MGIYSCGPTVYATPHIGNFRAFIFADLLRRSLEFLGFEVKQVMNITDVGHLVSDSDSGEDKLEKSDQDALFLTCQNCKKKFFTGIIDKGVGTIFENNEHQCPFCKKITLAKNKSDYLRAGGKIYDIARFYEDKFIDALEDLNIKFPHHLPRATDHILEQVELVKKLTEKGFTYETSDGIYFDTSKFKNYGKLSGQKLEEKEAGARVEVKSEKKNPADFALWKFCVGENEKHILRWPNPSGEREGFPGWHLECSAMSSKYLGETFDIHTGGVDHIPVHHENEIAQSEAASGKKFVNYWLHNEFLTVDGGKMSKSLGNLFTLDDLKKKGFDPLAFRYLCLNSHYRSKLNFTWEALKNAQNSLANLREIYQKLPEGGEALEKYVKKFQEALADDLNSPQALAVAWEAAKDDVIDAAVKRATLVKFEEVLALDLDKKEEAVKLSAEQEKLLKEREKARKEKDWGRSDEIRDEFLKAGLEIEDTGEGQIVKRKS